MNDDQKAYTFASTYGDRSTTFHRHMISVVVFFYSNKLQIVFVDYTVAEMVCFDYYLYAAPRVKTISRNGITTFLLRVDQCITFNQKKKFTATLIAEELL